MSRRKKAYRQRLANLKRPEKIRNIQSETIPDYDPTLASIVENENETLKEELMSMPVPEQVLSNKEMARLREGTKHIPLSSLLIMLPDFQYDVDKIIEFCKNLVVPQLVCSVSAQIIASSAEHLKKPKQYIKSNKKEVENKVKPTFFLKTKIPEEADTLVDFYKNNKQQLDAPNHTKSSNPEQIEHLKKIYDEFPERKTMRNKKRNKAGRYSRKSSKTTTRSDYLNNVDISESAPDDILSTSSEVSKSDSIQNSAAESDDSVILIQENSSSNNSSVINETIETPTSTSGSQSVILEGTEDKEDDDKDVSRIDPPVNGENLIASSSQNSGKSTKRPFKSQKKRKTRKHLISYKHMARKLKEKRKLRNEMNQNRTPAQTD